MHEKWARAHATAAPGAHGRCARQGHRRMRGEHRQNSYGVPSGPESSPHTRGAREREPPMTDLSTRHLLVLDTEATGLNPRRDEVLSLSIIDREGRTVLDERFGAVRHDRWDAAQTVHGIAPEDLKGLKPLGEHRSRVARILGGTELLVGYNLAFDLAFLASAGIEVPAGTLTFDVMREFARIHGLRSQRHPNGRWVSLAECARHHGFAFAAHSSLADAQATLLSFKRIREEIKERGASGDV